MHSFLGLIAPGNCPFLPRAALPSVIVSGLSQAGEVRQPRHQETSCRQNEDSGYVKDKGRGSIIPFFYIPLRPSLRDPSWPCLSQVILPLRNLTRHWLTSHLPGAKQGEVKDSRGDCPYQEDKLCLLSGLWSQGLFTQPQPWGVTASETRQSSSQEAILSLWLHMIFSLCMHVFAQISSSNEDPSHTRFGPTLMNSF